MNIYKVLNEICEYIDENLEEKIDYDVFAKMMGVNTYTMQRIFSLLTNISLSEYIRRRRLTMAGYELCSSKQKIIDIALKYGYENATSFSRAFVNFHGIKPSLVKSDSSLKNYPRLIFKEDIKIADTMEYKTVYLEELILYGTYISVNNDNISKKAPEFWEKINRKYKDYLIDEKYAMIEYDNEFRDNCRKYFVLFKDNFDDFEKVVIPAGKWLFFRIYSQEAEKIQEVSKNFYFEFLPSCKFNLKESSEIEYYHDGVTDFLIPIY